MYCLLTIPCTLLQQPGQTKTKRGFGPRKNIMEDYDDDLAAYMADDGPGEYDAGICPACSGSGEGEFDGAVCHTCRGRGES